MAAVACAALALPWLPYLAVAAQTVLFGESLKPAVNHAYIKTGEMCGSVQDKVFTYQVLWTTPWAAEVYLVTPCSGGMLENGEQGRNATTIDFQRTAHGWQYEDYDTPWSDCGSADGNVFPPDPQANSF